MREPVKLRNPSTAMTKFEDTAWAQAGNCHDYQDEADHVVVERQTLFRIVGSFYRKFLGVGQGHRVLDLGCGDGVMGGTLRAMDNSIQLIAVDGSPDMIAAARQRLGDCPSMECRVLTFQEILAQDPCWTKLDLVMSAFAIHHLDRPEKAALFGKIHAMLRAGGYFINVDVLLPQSRVYEDWFYELWTEWIAERQRRLGLAEDFSHVPAQSRARPENKFEDLESHLGLLRQAGFGEVECFYRYGLFGVCGGRKIAPASVQGRRSG